MESVRVKAKVILPNHCALVDKVGSHKGMFNNPDNVKHVY